MSDPRVPQKIHTFADDLAAARQARGIVAPETLKTTPAKNTTSSKSDTTPQEGPIKLSATATRDASYPALLITDQKRKKVGLTAAIGNGLSAWWSEQLDRVSTKKKPPAYVTPSVALDKGKTSVRSARDVVSPQQEIAAKLRAAEKAPVKAATTPKKVAVATTTDETPVWDTNDLLQPTATPLPVPTIIETTPHVDELAVPEVPTVIESAPRILPVIPAIVQETSQEESASESGEYEDEDTEPFVLFEEENYDDEPVEEKPTPEPLIPSPISRPKITPTIPTAAAAPVTSLSLRPITDRLSPVTQLRDEETPTIPSALRGDSEIAAQRREQARQASTQLPAAESQQTNSRLLSLWPYAGALLFVAITAGTIAYFVLGSSDTPVATDVATSFPGSDQGSGDGFPTTPNTATMSAQLDAPNRSSLYSAIMNSRGSGDSLFMVTPLAHDTGLPLKPIEILLLMNRSLAADLTGNITSVKLGSYRDTPVIILSVVDETRVRGGLFEWEETLSYDLSPWFGMPLRKTSGSALSYSDSTITGHDVRILKDDLGNDQIVYGFVNNATVIITKNSDSFLNIASTLPSY